VVDGELVAVLRNGLPRLDFDTLGQRIHPAASRVKLLAETTPASFIAFDLLALGDENLLERPYPQRRARLETALASSRPPVHLTPVTADLDTARRWFEMFEGAGLDGLVAKPAELRYAPGKRLMYKVKHARTADVVVAGFRWHKSAVESKDAVGSLLLGLYDDKGMLHHVGVSASFSAARRRELLAELEPYRTEIGDHPWAGFSDGQRVPGAPSRWSGTKDLSWLPLRPDLVCEVAYDHLEGDRFRHTAQFVRWRPDRDPRSCRYDQLDRPVRFDVDRVLAGRPEERP
jgi:ATP-dependent DNA ligase